MSVTDTLKTVAILDNSQYLRAAREVSRATEGMGDAGMYQAAATGATVLGGLLLGVGASAIKTASQFQQMDRSITTLGGSGLFSKLKSFTFSTPYTTSDWAVQTRTLMGLNVAAKDVIPIMRDLGDAVTAANGVDTGKLAQLAYAYGEMNIGFANARHLRMFVTAGVPAYQYLQKYMGMTEKQVANIGLMHIPGRYVNAAIRTGIEDDPKRHDAMLTYMLTLAGETSNLKDAWQQFLASAGTGALEPLGKGIHFLADELKSLSNVGSSKTLGYILFGGGPALLAAGYLLPIIANWKALGQAKDIAKIAAVSEMGAEKAKLTVMTEEQAELAVTTTRWGRLGTAITGVGSNLLKFMAIAAKAAIAVDALKEAGGAFADPKGTAYDTGHDLYRSNRKAALIDELTHPIRSIGAGISMGGGAHAYNEYANAAKDIVTKSGDKYAQALWDKSVNARVVHNSTHWSSTPWSEIMATDQLVDRAVRHARAYDPSQAASDDSGEHAKNAALLNDFRQHRGEYFQNAEHTAASKRSHAKLGVKKKGGKGGFDPLVTQILGGASEDELIKHGVNRRFFKTIGAGKLPQDPFKAALAQLHKRPMVIQMQIGDKVIQSMKVEVQDDLVKVFAAILSSSQSRAQLGAS